MKRLLMISTDRLILDKTSDVSVRQIENAKKWDEVFIIVFAKRDRSSAGEILLSQNCRAYPTRSFSKFNYPFDAIKIGRSIVEKNGITEITCQDPSLTAMVGAKLKEDFNIPLEIQIHGDISSTHFAHSFENKIRLMLARRYLPRADKIRVVSNRIKEYVESILIGSNDIDHDGSRNESRPMIEVRPIAVDADLIKNAPITIDLHNKYPQFTKIALMASRLEKEKNIAMAVEAWVKVKDKLPKAGLIIVGQGSEKPMLKKMISKLSLDEDIIMENWTDKATLFSYYKTADLFLNTSLFEGYGMTLIEAKAAGCPVISTDVGVAKETGAKISKFDACDLARNIINSFEGHD